jgi:hypothetical protein
LRKKNRELKVGAVVVENAVINWGGEGPGERMAKVHGDGEAGM